MASKEELQLRIYQSPYWRPYVDSHELEIDLIGDRWQEVIRAADELEYNAARLSLDLFGDEPTAREYCRLILLSKPLRESILLCKSYSQLDSHINAPLFS